MQFDIEASRFNFVHAPFVDWRKEIRNHSRHTKQLCEKSHTKQIYGKFIVLLGKIRFKYIFLKENNLEMCRIFLSFFFFFV